MIGDVREGVAKDATLGERPVAGKTGTSEGFFDAWFVGYEPQRLTGIWMGDGEEGATLDCARKINGLSGGITPAEIWKTYMQYVVAGEPVQNFEGVKPPREPVGTTAPAEGFSDEAAGEPVVVPPQETMPAGLGTTASPPPEEPGAAPTASSVPASAAPSSVEPSGVTPSSGGAASPSPR